jgi:hypothetical protein
MLPASQKIYGLRDGERATGTLRISSYGCLIGDCRVAFEAAGTPVVAELPVGSSRNGHRDGDPLVIRYRAADPQVVAAEADTDYGDAVFMVALPGLPGLVLLLGAVPAGIAAWRRRSLPNPV